MAELPYLCRNFRRVIIVPEIKHGQPLDLSSYQNITIDTSRSESMDHRHPISKLSSAFCLNVLSQLFKSIRYIPMTKWLQAWSMAINRHRIGLNLHRIIDRHNINCAQTVFYTFWFNHITEAVALAIPKHDGALVSCAHGYDIYPYVLKIWPFRELALNRMSRLYVASHSGAEYICKKHPTHSSKISVHTLGSNKIYRDATTRPHSGSEPITFLSCSRVDKNKRVELNFDFIKALSKKCPNQKFLWIHIGDGNRMEIIRKKLAKGLPSNLKINLLGAIPNSEVHRLYATIPIDWTMLMSELEGGKPIALSESMSYGVPIITCDVPGCREIANDNVGCILSANPSAEEFIAKISPFITGEKSQLSLRQNAYRHWAMHYDATLLRASFAIELSDLKC